MKLCIFLPVMYRDLQRLLGRMMAQLAVGTLRHRPVGCVLVIVCGLVPDRLFSVGLLPQLSHNWLKGFKVGYGKDI